MKYIFKKFMSEKRGDVAQYILVLSVIVVIAAFSFIRVKTTVKCTQETTNAHLYEVLFNKKEESTTCQQDGQNENGDENENTTNNGNEDVTNNNGNNSSGNGSNTGSGTNTDDNGNEIEDENELPLSHFEESGVDLTCVNASSYYSFTIPSSAPPQSIGTQAITLKNKKGWDMWVKISSITTSNGLRITTDDSFYRKLSDGEEVAFNVGWKWSVPSNYTGEKGNAKVSLSVICKEPASNELYKPIVSAPKNFRVVETKDTSISLAWDKVDYASEYYIYRNGSLVYKGSTPSYIDENILPGTTYTYKLFTSFTTGTDVYASLSQKTTGVSPIPPAPTNFIIYSITDNSFHINWDRSSKAIQYRIFLDGKEVGAHIYSYLQTNLKPNTKYKVEVVAENTYGSSEKSTMYVTTNEISSLLNPANFRQADRTTTTNTIAWNPVSGATSYKLVFYGKVLYQGPDTVFTHTNLVPGNGGPYFLYALNGTNSSSGLVKSMSPLGIAKPPTPYNISITNITNTSIRLSWTKGGDATTVITMNGEEVYNDTGNSAVINNLTPNTYYKIELYSRNSSGPSPTARTSVFTTNDTYDDISNLSATCNDENYSQSFTIPTNIKIGESGLFLINATNNTNKNLSLKIIKVEKNGDIFGGSTPVKLEYDDSTITLQSKEKFNIPIKWILPSNATSDYTTKKGDITITLSTSC